VYNFKTSTVSVITPSYRILHRVATTDPNMHMESSSGGHFTCTNHNSVWAGCVGVVNIKATA